MFDLGIKSISGTGNQADFTCGCFYDNNAGVAGYALFTCPQKHFQAQADLERLIEALDSHEYWQLSDESERHSGYVILPGDLSEEGEPVEDLDAENHDEIRA